jgi:hypothetical protein
MPIVRKISPFISYRLPAASPRRRLMRRVLPPRFLEARVERAEAAVVAATAPLFRVAGATWYGAMCWLDRWWGAGGAGAGGALAHARAHFAAAKEGYHALLEEGLDAASKHGIEGLLFRRRRRAPDAAPGI